MEPAPAFESLLDLAKQIVKHKDAFERKITSIEPEQNGFVVIRKDGSRQRWVVMDRFSYAPGRIDAKDKAGQPKTKLVLLCTSDKENIRAVVKGWDALIKEQDLSVYFVDVKTGNKWNIMPRVHDLIAERSTLESGLVSLMDAANGIVKEEPRRKKKQSMFEESSQDEEEQGDA
jgi:hypothetical protein